MKGFGYKSNHSTSAAQLLMKRLTPHLDWLLLRLISSQFFFQFQLKFKVNKTHISWLTDKASPSHRYRYRHLSWTSIKDWLAAFSSSCLFIAIDWLSWSTKFWTWSFVNTALTPLLVDKICSHCLPWSLKFWIKDWTQWPNSTKLALCDVQTKQSVSVLSKLSFGDWLIEGHPLPKQCQSQKF